MISFFFIIIIISRDTHADVSVYSK